MYLCRLGSIPSDATSGSCIPQRSSSRCYQGFIPLAKAVSHNGGAYCEIERSVLPFSAGSTPASSTNSYRPRDMPDASILQHIFDQGHWAPLPISVLTKLLDIALAAGNRFDKDIAMADVILHTDRGISPSIRDYATRWKWPKTTVERFLQELYSEKSSGTVVGQQWDSCGTKNGDSEPESDSCGTAVGQQWDSCGTVAYYIDRAQQTSYKNINNKNARAGEREGDGSSESTPHTPTPLPVASSSSEVPPRGTPTSGTPPEDLSGWTPESLPVRESFIRWVGHPPDAAMMQTIRLLLMPHGAPQGARIPGETRIYNGFTPDDLIRGIEDLKMSKHYSPASLVRHVAGLMPAPQGQTTRGQPRGQPSGNLPEQAGWMTEEQVRRLQEREPRIKHKLEAWKMPDGTRYRRPTTTPAPEGWTIIYKPAMATA